MTALLFLSLSRCRNSFRRALRQPRVLIPALLLGVLLAAQGVALLFLLAGGGVRNTIPVSFGQADLLFGGPGAFLLALRGVFLLSLFSAANAALADGGVFFTPSDVDFLFPAPLARRSVLLSRMLGRYLRLLLPAVYIPLTIGGAALAGSARLSVLAYWPGFLGAWFYLTAATNLAQGVALGRRDTGQDVPAGQVRGTLRKVVGLLTFALLVGGLYLVLRFLSGRGVVEVGLIAQAVHSDVWNQTLLPDAWVAHLFGVAFVGWTPGDCWRLVGLFVLSAVSFLWLYGRDRDFYDAATAVAAKRARAQNAVRSGDVGAVVSDMAREGEVRRGVEVPEFGGGAWAILWKDWIGVLRAPVRSWFQLLFLATLPALAGGLLGRRGVLNLFLWNGLFAIQMAGFFLLSLRDMLRRADLSRCLPIAPWKFLLAELALSVAQLTILGWFSLLVMVLAGLGSGPLVWVCAWTLPTLAALVLLVQTVVLLIYPSVTDPAHGMLSGIFNVVASLLALLPGVIAGIVVSLLHAPHWLLALTVSAANLGAAAVALTIASWLWRRYDPTD